MKPRGARKGRLRRRFRRLLPRPRLLRRITRLTSTLPTQGNRIHLFHDGDELFARMLDDIRAARVRISLEMYMFLGDRTGWRFAHALANKAREGVPVRVVYDSLGSLGLPVRLIELLQGAGVEVLEFNPVAPWRRRWAVWRRNHRKSLIVDGHIGYTGGVNIGDPWVSRRRGGQAWRDTHARVEGPAAHDLEVHFIDTWAQKTGEVLDLSPPQPRDEDPPDDDPQLRQQVYVIGERLWGKRRMRRMYQLSIGRARESVSITSSYFVPGRRLRRALKKARAREVRVRLLLPYRTDVRITQFASRWVFTPLVRAGVEIYLYHPSVLHAKSAVVDGHWAIVGSSNIDSFSFRRNLEANLIVIGDRTPEELLQSFERDLSFSRPVSLGEWRRRPWLPRILEWLAYSLRAFL